MKSENDRLMKEPEQEISTESKKVWMKTLVDVESLVDSGAEV